MSSAAAATAESNPLLPRPPHFAAKAKSCIFLFMYGGPSQMDLFDYKPELQKRDGQTVNMEIRRRDVQSSKLLASKRTFKQHGQDRKSTRLNSSHLVISDAVFCLEKKK